MSKVRQEQKVKVDSLVEVEGDEKVILDEMATEFDKYFASIFTEEKQSDSPLAEDIFVGQDRDMLTDINIDEAMVMKKLAKLRADTATDSDDMSPRFMREAHR